MLPAVIFFQHDGRCSDDQQSSHWSQDSSCSVSNVSQNLFTHRTVRFSFQFILSSDLFVLCRSLSWWLPRSSLLYSPAGFLKSYLSELQALSNYFSLHSVDSLCPVWHFILCLCPCALHSATHTLTHSLQWGGGFHLADLAPPSPLPHPNLGPTALHSTGQQMPFRWM